MIRFLGILAGAAVAVAVLILVVGLPQFPDAAPEDAVPQTALPVATVAPAEEEPPSVAARDDEPEQEAAQDAVSEFPVLPEAADEAQQASSPPPDRWYAFWSPFRSELAANGFVTQLQRTTGLDYRVVKLKPGVYEVAFAYADDAEIEARLAQISAATGLDMREHRE